MLISKINIRATAFSEFWGEGYKDSIYLWEGAKHTIPFSRWDEIDTPVLKDRFATEQEVGLAHEHCKKVYEKLLPLLGAKLNEIHRIDMPVSFWRTVFCIWLFEYISIVYEKFTYLSELDLDSTDIKLLDKDSFYIPAEFVDSHECFTSDFGVQQLVSQYYYLFSSKNFPSVSKKFQSDEKKQRRGSFEYFVHIAKQSARNLIRTVLPKKNYRVILLKTYINRKLIKQLESESKGEIKYVRLPKVGYFSDVIDCEKRQELLNIEMEKDGFEHFLVQSLYYCLPRAVVEHFSSYYSTFLKDIKSRRFDYIVSEKWIGDFATAIYAATAQAIGSKLIYTQHGAYVQLCKNNFESFLGSATDIYLTMGWEENRPNVIAGGFASREVTPYEYQPWKKDILYVCNAWPIYMVRFTDAAVGNTTSVTKLKMLQEFIDFLPDSLAGHFVLRARPLAYHWDALYTLQVKKKNIRLDDVNQDLLVSLSNAGIAIIDYWSTALAEILVAGLPCLIIRHPQIETLSDEYKDLFDELTEVGVVHNSNESAISQLVRIYEDVQGFWNSEPVRTAVGKFKKKTLGPPSKTVQYLLSCAD